MSENDSNTVPVNELFFGIVRAVGTDATKAKGEIARLLHTAGYHVEDIDVASFLVGESPKDKPAEYYQRQLGRMDQGDLARQSRPDALALRTIAEIVKRRTESDEAQISLGRRYAYIIDPVVHPKEVQTFRTVYGNHFFLVSLYEDEDRRHERLSACIEQSLEGETTRSDRRADEIMDRDRGKGAKSHSIAIDKTFHLGDVFIDINDPVNRESPRRRNHRRAIRSKDGLTTTTLHRLFEQIFSGSRYVPSKHEVAMAYAYSASLRSANLARRVGAAIVTPDGTMLSTGYNDVPAPGGGQYPVQRNDGAILDSRDDVFTPPLGDDLDDELGFELEEQYGYDANDLIKYDIFRDLMNRLKNLNLLADTRIEPRSLLFDDEGPISREDKRTLREIYGRKKTRAAMRQVLRQADLFDVIEFSRSVHAEMSALLSALRHGIPVRGCYLYSTTFPCHECARHIIAAGIDRVVYVEPYPKSRVSALYVDEIVLGQRSVAQNATDRRPVEFIPFIGISLERRSDLFSATKRKEDFGRAFPPGRAIDEKQSSFEDIKDPTHLRLRWISNDELAEQLAANSRALAEKEAVRLLRKVDYRWAIDIETDVD